LRCPPWLLLRGYFRPWKNPTTCLSAARQLFFSFFEEYFVRQVVAHVWQEAAIPLMGWGFFEVSAGGYVKRNPEQLLRWLFRVKESAAAKGLAEGW